MKLFIQLLCEYFGEKKPNHISIPLRWSILLLFRILRRKNPIIICRLYCAAFYSCEWKKKWRMLQSLKLLHRVCETSYLKMCFQTVELSSLRCTNLSSRNNNVLKLNSYLIVPVEGPHVCDLMKHSLNLHPVMLTWCLMSNCWLRGAH